ncbi:MAG: nitroreductase family protein [Planctomycetota bacterium]
MSDPRFVPYRTPAIPAPEMLRRATEFHDESGTRRSVRHFSQLPVPRELIEIAIATANSAPSGANRQPWTFVAVGNPEVKRQIREAAEVEERENYEGGRMPPDWLEALAPLGTGWHKEFLEEAPWLVVVFAELHKPFEGGIRKNYYVSESVGIACGLFIAAVHHMGLATLTHTPSPMGFLSKTLGRPSHEKPYILFPVGFPAENCTVPDIPKKAAEEVTVWIP